MHSWRATLKHLRIPFSYHLLPIFLFAMMIDPAGIDMFNLGLLFVILHLFIYPASNGYNSYFDKDEQSIGGIKNPPKVDINLYRTSLVLDAVGLALAWIISWQIMLLVLVYGLISKAYSHPWIRLKRMPIIGWFMVSIFQGYFIFCTTYLAIHTIAPTDMFVFGVQLPALLSTLMLFGSYPMTQIYQHEEDGRRGDYTISRKLGILGTFHFTAIVFTLATAGYIFFFVSFMELWIAILYLILLGPVLVFFGWWYWRVRKHTHLANYDNTMRLNTISSSCLNIFFILVFLITS